jgi:hypothetical protein
MKTSPFFLAFGLLALPVAQAQLSFGLPAGRDIRRVEQSWLTQPEDHPGFADPVPSGRVAEPFVAVSGGEINPLVCGSDPGSRAATFEDSPSATTSNQSTPMNTPFARFARPLLVPVFGLLATAAVAQTAHYEPRFVLTDPDGGSATPPNVVRTRTVNAAIYPVINSVKVKLAVENPLHLALRVRLLNDRGEMLYSVKLARRRSVDMHCFDMGNMQDGLYTVEVSDGVNQWPLEFTLESNRQAPVVVPERVIAVR